MGQVESAYSDEDDDCECQVTECTPCRHICLTSSNQNLYSFINNLAREICQGGIQNLKGKLPIMIDFKKFNLTHEYLPSRVLLGNMFQNLEDPDLIRCFEWMMKNQEKVVFMIYSLDTLPNSLQYKRPFIGYYETTFPSSIVQNLLYKNFFPKSLVISTSSQKRFDNIHPMCHPDHFIKMDNISEDSQVWDIRQLIGRNPLEKSKKMHKNVYPQGPHFDETLEALGVRNSSGRSGHTGSGRQKVVNHDIAAKKRTVTARMIEALNSENNECRRLELLLYVYEGKNSSAPIVRAVSNMFELSDVLLYEFDIEAVSFLMGLAKHISNVDLRRCNLNARFMEVMANKLSESSVKIDRFDVSNNELHPRGIGFFAKIVKHCKVKCVAINGCGIKLPHLQKLLAVLTADCKLTELHISQNKIGLEGMSSLGKLLKQCAVKQLTMNNCNLSSGHVKNLVDGVAGLTLDTVDLSDWEHNPAFCEEIRKLLQCVRREIRLHGWQIDAKQQRSIHEELCKINSKVLVVHLNGGFELRAH